MIKIKTTLALGVINILRVAIYRTGLRSGLSSARNIDASFVEGLFFRETDLDQLNAPISSSAWVDKRSYFSFHQEFDESIPDWHSNSLFGARSESADTHWWEIPDFDSSVGDIKLIWESSRLDWVITFAQRARREKKYFLKINLWLNNWCRSNPPYLGVNWKCGQEASIRVMHIAVAAIILGQERQPESALIRFIEVHLKRILPTISYAVAQNNNHGTSEAAALFIGGSWLKSIGVDAGDRYMKVGRKWLENRSRKLVLSDGTFSQYSITYHRLMLDTYSLVECWRVHFDLPEFSQTMLDRLKLSANWLFQFTSTVNGDAPNLGANDGASLLPLSRLDYRDFRPSVQLASVLFEQVNAYAADVVYDAPLLWLGITKPQGQREDPKTTSFDDGGYQLLRVGDNFASFNTQQFNFRPSQSDVLHLDVWFKGQCILCDGGTYSYNCEPLVEQYFSGVKSHNTVEFDQRDQMPKLSRFLFGEWLDVDIVRQAQLVDGVAVAQAKYLDYQGASHDRTVSVTDTAFEVLDLLSGFDCSAVLRWRFASGRWIVNQDEQTISDGNFLIKITSSERLNRFELVEGWQSLYYQNQQSISVLEVEISTSGWIKTELGII